MKEPIGSGTLPRSQLSHMIERDAFRWATGIEDTFITAAAPGSGRTLDEYALTRHYARWRDDQRRMAELGVRLARYGIPWHRVNPAPNRWNWSWAERALDHLLELRIDPIVDLVHYGAPPWLEGAFLNPDFPRRIAEYAARLAERFRGRIHWYTPLNEPRITAWYCGRLGWWPPFRKGWRGFVELMLALARGIIHTGQALLAVDPEIVLVHVDATDLYSTPDPALQPEVERRQQLVWLGLDLISGRVTERHPLHDWLIEKGANEFDLTWFQEHALELDVVGLNLYPMYSDKELVRTRRGLRIRMRYASADIVNRLGELYWRRYSRPMLISETASAGSIVRRRRWLEDSVRSVRALREQGIPLVGYTWWPLFSLVAWAYRQGSKELGEYLLNMGLWDLDPETLDRIPTPLVEEYRRLVSGGAQAVGTLMAAEPVPAR